MSPQTIRADQALVLAHNFRLRAAEAGDTSYHPMLMRAAVDLEELANTLMGTRAHGLVVIDGDHA